MTSRESATGLGSAPAAEEISWDATGLCPAIVQDATNRQVLMLGWMDREAYDATLETGEVHFHSRSRDRLWRKGETSGNVLRLRGVALDCDADTLLIQAEPAGPTCHRGTRSCFDPEGATRSDRTRDQGFATLEALWATITDRASTRPPGSYTASLIGGGVDAAGRKVTEEATELLLAARDDAERERSVGHSTADRSKTSLRVAEEAADLVYHSLVLLAERGIEPRAFLEVLATRAR